MHLRTLGGGQKSTCLFKTQRLRRTSAVPFGASHKSATFRCTRSRACARRIDWRKIDSSFASVSVLSWLLSPTSQRSTSSAVSSVSRRRSEEHTSELQSRQYLVCRLLLEKKKSNPMRDALGEPKNT